MRTLTEIGTAIDAAARQEDALVAAGELLELAEEILEHWVESKGLEPTREQREGFRLLALHRQGTKGDPSFNACRETCREVAYHYNLVRSLSPSSSATEITHRVAMMAMVCRHLHLFVSGKLEVAALGEFCCSSRPLREARDVRAN